MKFIFLFFPLLLFCVQSFAATDKDNIEINKRESAASELTADQQTSSNSDMDITRRIRQFIMKHAGKVAGATNVKNEMAVEKAQ